MPRKYAVLKQFTVDLNRLLTEAETAYRELKAAKSPDQAQILKLFRPIHSLKGICAMVEEAKLLVKAFHLFEDALPPLLPVRDSKADSREWISIAEATFGVARETEKILLRKIELWRELGADENDTRGLIVAFRHEKKPATVWVPITSLLGLAGAEEYRANGSQGRLLGEATDGGEILLIETQDGSVSLQFDEIRSTCSRLEAVQAGVPQSFKDWWSAVQKSGSKTAA